MYYTSNKVLDINDIIFKTAIVEGVREGDGDR